jgi:hypothetical protein
VFAQYIGPDPGSWYTERLVAQSLSWLRTTHPHLAGTVCRAMEFERIRNLFDFSFWMGLAGGR